MAKVKTPNQKSKYRMLNKRLSKYVLLVEQIYEQLNLESAKIAMATGYNGEKPFRFSDYPVVRERVNNLKRQFVSELGSLIYSGTSDEWKQSNVVQDLLADRVLKSYGAKANGVKKKVYYQTNSDALKAFQQRKDSGMTLSDKLWNQAANYRQEMEYAISSAIQKGTSAVTLSKRLSKYLQDFPKLKKDYKEKYGQAVKCHDCEYRSIRLARSEINMAYRTAEQTRWQQMDFVVGYEIKLSAKHPCHDVCDSLAGKYPKDFKWTGWHPNDMCYLVPILNTEDEFWSDSETSVNQVKDVPDGFKKWVKDNKDRLALAEKNGTLPYFVKDNNQYVSDIQKAKKGKGKMPSMNPDKLLKNYKDYPDFVKAKERELSEIASRNLSREDLKKAVSDFKADLDNSFQKYAGSNYTEKFTVYDQKSYKKVMDMMGNATKPAWQAASYESRQAFVDYTGIDSRRILSDLGNGRSNAKANLMAEVLDNIHTTEDLVLRSGQRTDMLGYIFGNDFQRIYERGDLNKLNSKFSGKVGVNKAFMSTSFNERGGLRNDVELHIFAPKGTSCINLNEISDFGGRRSVKDWNGYDFAKTYERYGETEFLLNKGYRYKFLRVESASGLGGNDRIYIQLLNRIDA